MLLSIFAAKLRFTLRVWLNVSSILIFLSIIFNNSSSEFSFVQRIMSFES